MLPIQVRRRQNSSLFVFVLPPSVPDWLSVLHASGCMTQTLTLTLSSTLQPERIRDEEMQVWKQRGRVIREQERLVWKGGGGVSDLSFCGQKLALLPRNTVRQLWIRFWGFFFFVRFSFILFLNCSFSKHFLCRNVKCSSWHQSLEAFFFFSFLNSICTLNPFDFFFFFIQGTKTRAEVSAGIWVFISFRVVPVSFPDMRPMMQHLV